MKCCICSQDFLNYRSLNGHMRVHGPSQGKHTIKRKRLSYIKFNCLYCNKEGEYQKGNRAGKYCNNKCQRLYEWNNITKPRIEQGKCCSLSSTAILRYLIERDGYKCQTCQIEKWNGEFIRLDIDHIDGNNKNNLPINLRLLCPNCHRQTDTWGNNKGNKITYTYKSATKLILNMKQDHSSIG